MISKYELSIVAIVKNEGQYIKEWIDYHHLIGIDHIFLFDNGSDDNTKDVAKKYVDKGFITLIDYPGLKKQISAYNYAIRRFKKLSKYIAFIDADEFIYVHNNDIKGTIKSILKKDPKAAGVAVNWRMFGAAGHETKPEGFVIENYLYRAEYGKKGNNCVKSIVNPRKVLFFHNPHYPIYFPIWHSIDENGRIVKKWSNDVEETKYIQLNHYFTKSKEEWIKRRSTARADNGKKRALEEFNEHNNNDIFDDSMLKYANVLKRK